MLHKLWHGDPLIFFVTIVQLFVEQIRHPEDTYSLMLEEEETLEKVGGITIWRVRNRCEQRPDCPETKASLFSLLSFWWVNGLMKTGYEQPLQEHHLWDMSTELQASRLAEKFQDAWNKQLQKEK